MMPSMTRGRTATVADRERQRTYDAEKIVRRMSEREGSKVELFGTTITWPAELRFGHIDHVAAYVRNIESSDWYRATFPKASQSPVKVRHRKGDKWAHYDGGTQTIAINAPDNKTGWAMREIVVLHELAHHVDSLEDMGGESHGPEFRGVFCFLVSQVIGPEAGWILSVTFFDVGLQVRAVQSGVDVV